MANYDNSHAWIGVSAGALFVKAANAFDGWRTTRGEEKAQDFLLSA
jgi:hypothetical protein